MVMGWTAALSPGPLRARPCAITSREGRAADRGHTGISRTTSGIMRVISCGSAAIWPEVRQPLAAQFCVRDRSDEGRMPMSAPEPVAGERADLLQSLARQRHFLRYMSRGLTGEQAAQQTTASELFLGGLIKHGASAEMKRHSRLMSCAVLSTPPSGGRRNAYTAPPASVSRYVRF